MAKKILILDDEKDILEIFKYRLERAGYMVVAAPDGKQGLRAAQTERFDLIVTDVLMPVMDGFHFLKELKTMPDYKNIPVIVVTGHGSMEDTFRALGVAEFFKKPVEFNDLLAAIERFLNPNFRQMTRRKIVVLGSEPQVVSDMVRLLSDQGQDAVAVRDEIEFFSKVLTSPPDMVIVDVLLPSLLAHEIIKALRAFSVFSRLTILTYTHFTEKELTSVDAVEQLKEAKNLCMESGATAYIGRFSKVTFIDSIGQY